MQSRWLTDWFSWAKAAHAPKTTDSCFPKEVSLWSFLDLLPEARSWLKGGSSVVLGADIVRFVRTCLPHLKFSPIQFLHLVIRKEVRLGPTVVSPLLRTGILCSPVHAPRVQYKCGRRWKNSRPVAARVNFPQIMRSLCK